MRGDRAAFRDIVATTSRRLYRLAVRMTGDGTDAEDVLQEAYLRAHQALCDGGWDRRARVETWLYRIVVNTALNARRDRGRRRRALADGASVDGMAGAARPAQETSVAVAQLMALVRELPAGERAALVLKELEGMTASEIGEVLGCSEGAVEQRLVRARSALRARWQP